MAISYKLLTSYPVKNYWNANSVNTNNEEHDFWEFEFQCIIISTAATLGTLFYSTHIFCLKPFKSYILQISAYILCILIGFVIYIINTTTSRKICIFMSICAWILYSLYQI